VTFTERLRESFLQIVQYIPALLGALIILFAGYLFARLIQRGVERVLRWLQFNRLLERGGVLEAVDRGGSRVNPIRVVANLVFWLLMFAVLLLAAQALGFPALADVFQDLISAIPSVIAAIVIIVIGIVLGDFVGGLISASAGGIHGGTALARVGRGGIILLAVFMALQQIGVATEIVTTAFAILFGAVALALALSFGLGNRELAAEITREWYAQYRAEREAAEHDTAERATVDDGRAGDPRGPSGASRQPSGASAAAAVERPMADG
jgi:hypothetical protein